MNETLDQAAASAVEEVIDPVCGMTITRADSVGTFNHKGRTYYFCAESCLEQFSADPERFLDPARRDEARAAGDEDAEYTCPMHPEVRQKGPGACPICGMALEPVEVAVEDRPNEELLDMTRRFYWGFALTLPILAVMVSELLPTQPLQRAWPAALNWMEFALATPVVLWAGWPFFERGWASVRSRHFNMFTLIAMGVGAAYFFSVAATVAPGVFPDSFQMHGKVAVYFEPAAVIVVLVLLGQVLELRARGRTSAAIRGLLNLAPKTARLVRSDGGDEDIPVEHVKSGDVLRVRPGERVPVDGVILDGNSAIDESMITGEPIPVEKARDASVTGGTINGAGGFTMRATRVGRETLLAQIVRMVTEAQRSRAPIQRLADDVSGWFVPAVMLVAVVTFIAWSVYGPEPRLAHALVNAVAVLIIACPCALGLATPMSIMVGTGRGAESGVLIRDAEALEVFEKVTTLVVDKTGTVTEGKPALVTVTPAAGVDERVLLQLAASLENASEHPLAAAIVAGARARGLDLLPVGDFRSDTGRGVTGIVQQTPVVIGSARYLQELNADPEPLRATADRLREQGETAVFVAVDHKAAGLLGVADPVKGTAAEAVRDLKKEGLDIVMLTGDNPVTARAVARAVGIERVEAEVLPDQKATVIASLQQQGRRVAMAGDGINDAPALARADVGVAMGTGTDIAIESAGVTLVKGDLRGLVRVRKLSRETMKNIRQNLFFAFVYNTIGVPIAAGVLYPFFGLLLSPMIASAAMTFSSVSVIANALRLRRLPL